MQNTAILEITARTDSIEEESNHKKVRVDYLKVLHDCIKSDPLYANWSFLEEPSSKDDELFLTDGHHSMMLQYLPDGLLLKCEGDENCQNDFIVSVLKNYQTIYNKYHKNAPLSYHLTCQDKEIAQHFLSHATHAHLDFTSTP